jgi:aromatic ring-opening dioxygenase catalytic subunit (LigB family)
MYPSADIPCIQLSLVKGLDPETHIRMGKSLHNLLQSNILIIGSGFSFHNLRALFEDPTKETQTLNESFEAWLSETCSNDQLSEMERETRLVNWESAPGARYCHPREEHLLPLHVCYGIAGSECKQVFKMEVMKRKSSAYLW